MTLYLVQVFDINLFLTKCLPLIVYNWNILVFSQHLFLNTKNKNPNVDNKFKMTTFFDEECWHMDVNMVLLLCTHFHALVLMCSLLRQRSAKAR